MSIKPIHKFNGGRGATLCHKCRVIITEGLTEDLYCEKHGGKPFFTYKLTRKNDGLVKYADKINWVEWNEDGTFKNLSEDVISGGSLILDFSYGNFKWMTSTIKTYIKEHTTIEFETKNSSYILEKLK